MTTREERRQRTTERLERKRHIWAEAAAVLPQLPVELHKLILRFVPSREDIRRADDLAFKRIFLRWRRTRLD